MLNVPWCPNQDVLEFPDVKMALDDPDGLLMVGGNLSSASLINAYAKGIFPWFEDEQSILWWSPSVRAVIPTGKVRVTKNMRKLMSGEHYSVRMDSDFEAVIDACRDRDKTWIVDGMRDAYIDLHEKGIAHSVEVFEDGLLVGGLYGVFSQNCFSGESMFSFVSNASKIALISLDQFLLKYNCLCIDCQLPTEHLLSLGAVEVSRDDFTKSLRFMDINCLLVNKKWESLWQQL